MEPFRWDVTRRAALGGLLRGDRAPSYSGFEDDLLLACAHAVAAAGDASLAFVGRSPESLFDHLSGLLEETPWQGRLRLLQFSSRGPLSAWTRERNPWGLAAMRGYLRRLDLHPQGLARAVRPVAFVDLVATGGTFEQLVLLLRAWSLDGRSPGSAPWDQVRRKIRLVGLTRRAKNSPNTWRWKQHAPWLRALPPGAARSVSLGPKLWNYLGNWQPKVTRSHVPLYWGHEDNATPFRGKEQVEALRHAFDLVESGRSRERRAAFASLLAREEAMKEAWLRALVQSIRRGA